MRFFSERLKGLIKEGKVLQVVIVDSEGFVVETMGKYYDPEVLPSIFLPLEQVLKKVQNILEVNEVEEISLRTDGKKIRIILRNFPIDDLKFLLIAVCPISAPYRQIMTEIIHSDSENILQKVKRHDFEIQQGEKEEIALETSRESGMMEKAMEGRDKELGIEEEGAFKTSEEMIELISNRVLKKLLYSSIEKMFKERFLQIADQLIKKEIEKTKKEFTPTPK